MSGVIAEVHHERCIGDVFFADVCRGLVCNYVPDISPNALERAVAKLSKVRERIFVLSQQPEGIRPLAQIENDLVTEVHEIVPGIYVGTSFYADLWARGEEPEEGEFPDGFAPTTIISVVTHPKILTGVTHLAIPTKDSGKGFEEIQGRLSEIQTLLYRALADDKVALIHCREGISRSASLCAVWLAEATALPFPWVIRYMRAIRPQICFPHRGNFMGAAYKWVLTNDPLRK